MPDEVPKEFFDVADEFVHLANKLNEKWPSSRISSAMMFATARYNACNFYSHQKQNPDADVTDSIDYLCQQYREMLLKNMETLKPPANLKS